MLDDRDRRGVRTVLDGDPVATCMVAARVEIAGLDPWRLGGVVGGRVEVRRAVLLGANLVPLRGERAALRSFADRASARPHLLVCRRPGRAGAAAVDDLVEHWAPAREVRADQPLMVLAGAPAVRPDPWVRQVRPDELDRYLPAAIAMFTEEVGVDPRAGDGGAGYRAWWPSSSRRDAPSPGSRAARWCSRPRSVHCPRGSGRSRACGCTRRGAGWGWARSAPPRCRPPGPDRAVASLYVNAFNHPARAAYAKVGFRQVGSFATILF